MPRLCSQQSASINKGLAAPRSILIFKLTAERIRALPPHLPETFARRHHPPTDRPTARAARQNLSSIRRVYTYLYAFVCADSSMSLSLFLPPYLESPSLVSPPFLSSRTLFHFSVSLWHSLLVRVEHTRALVRVITHGSLASASLARSLARARVYTYGGGG